MKKNFVMQKKAVKKAMDESGCGSDLRRMRNRTGDNKIKNTVDDLLKLFSIIDEQYLSTPKYVVADLPRVQFLNADSINMVSMAHTCKMESLENRLAKMEEAFVSTRLSTAASHADVLHGGDKQVTLQQTSLPQTGDPSEPDAVYDVSGNGESDTSWSVVTGRYRPTRVHNVKSVPGR